MSSKAEMARNQNTQNQVGPTSLQTGKAYMTPGLPSNPQYGNPGKRSENDGPKTPKAG